MRIEIDEYLEKSQTDCGNTYQTKGTRSITIYFEEEESYEQETAELIEKVGTLLFDHIKKNKRSVPKL